MDPELAFMITGGSLLGLLQMLDADPAVDADEATDRLAESLLRMFGLSAEEAAEIAARPLPGESSDDDARTAGSESAAVP